MKPSIAIVRGKFLNRYEMQMFERLAGSFRLTAFASHTPLHDRFTFPVVKLPSPVDLPDFPYKMPILNRAWTDAHYLAGLEDALSGFDIAHTAETYYRYTQQALAAKYTGRVRYVVSTVWETIPFANEGIWGRTAYKRHAIRGIDRFVAVSQKARASLVAEGADPVRIEVINASVDTKRFAPEAASAMKNRRELTVVFVGRLEQEKGVAELLDAILLLAHDAKLAGTRIRWRFVGDGSQRVRITRALAQLPKNWHSSIESATYDEMPHVYRTSDISVAPSKSTPTWEEQWGMAITEALASGLPIVTTRTGAIPENVGDAALVVPPADARALADALRRYILSSPLRREYGTRARARAVARYDIRTAATKLDRLYRSLVRT